MPGSTYGRIFTAATFGESHGRAVGVVVDGIPAGMPLTVEEIQKELDLRRPGQSDLTTRRKESDAVSILSGIFEGKTTGTPVCLVIANSDHHPKDYDELKDLFRPGHADYTYHKKYGIRDHRGGGRSSGRETAARVAAGAIALKFLNLHGITITAYTLRAAGISCRAYDPSIINRNPMRACDEKAGLLMAEKISELSGRGESAGGIIECRVSGLSPGLGEPVFMKTEAEIGRGILSIGGVRGIEFGAGFSSADMTGSEWNDQMEDGVFLSNNAGGILGGITTGEQLVFRAAVKPTPSVGTIQKTMNTRGENRPISVKGRHDPCICPRIVPVIKCMTALTLADLFLINSCRRSLL